MCKEIYDNELVPVIRRPAAWRAGELKVQVRCDGSPSAGEVPLVQGCCLSSDSMRPVHLWRAVCLLRSPPIPMLISSKNTF